MSIDLPLIWAAVIALAVLLYVLLDGFDLGIGILFAFARSRRDRDIMMSTIAPVWDGNETWLVLGGGGLLAAFPLAYATVMPAFYLPIMIMLLALILRGVAFEFRARARQPGRRLWSIAFALGSLVAAVAQGLVLGGFVQGVQARDGVFAGGPLDWLTPYTLVVAAGLVCGYALLGASWLIMKTEDELHGDARRWARISAILVALFLAGVSLATLKVHQRIAERWGFIDGSFQLDKFLPLLPIPLLGLIGLMIIAIGLQRHSHRLPFVGAALVFLSGYLGLAAGFAPYIVPYVLTYEQAAAAPNALALMLAGGVVLLPAIATYTIFVYWLFRGKVTADAGYH